MSEQVLLESLAGRVGQAMDTVREELEAQGIPVGSTWDGEPSVAEDVARAWVAALEEHKAELERKEAAYSEYRRRRELERKDVGQAAYEAAYSREHERETRLLNGQQADGAFVSTSTLITLSPPGEQAAHEAAEKARSRFDRDNPIEPAELFEEEVT